MATRERHQHFKRKTAFNTKMLKRKAMVHSDTSNVPGRHQILKTKMLTPKFLYEDGRDNIKDSKRMSGLDILSALASARYEQEVASSSCCNDSTMKPTKRPRRSYDELSSSQSSTRTITDHVGGDRSRVMTPSKHSSKQLLSNNNTDVEVVTDEDTSSLSSMDESLSSSSVAVLTRDHLLPRHCKPASSAVAVIVVPTQSMMMTPAAQRHAAGSDLRVGTIGRPRRTHYTSGGTSIKSKQVNASSTSSKSLAWHRPLRAPTRFPTPFEASGIKTKLGPLTSQLLP